MKNIDVKTINRIIKISEILIIIGVLYAATLVFKSWKIGEMLLTVLKVLSPVFIGLFVAWLFDPLVDKLVNKKIKRFWASLLVYVVFIGILFLVLGTIIPLIASQVGELILMLPRIEHGLKEFINNVLLSFNVSDTNNIQNKLFEIVDTTSKQAAIKLPFVGINFAKSFFLGLGDIVIGLIIGFFILVSFGNTTNVLINYLPANWRSDGKEVMEKIIKSFRNFLKGALLDSTVIFVITSTLLWLVGLKAPLLFGFFCAITNVIPYAGPYIGGIPAVIVGFTQSPTIGFSVLATIVAIQFIEGNFFQPLIMSYSTKLHPVTIIAGLLIFGHFFGIIGMFISTPVIAIIKSIFVHFDEKYHILNN